MFIGREKSQTMGAGLEGGCISDRTRAAATGSTKDIMSLRMTSEGENALGVNFVRTKELVLASLSIVVIAVGLNVLREVDPPPRRTVPKVADVTKDVTRDPVN